MTRTRPAMACVWDPDRQATWSHIPAQLLRAMQQRQAVLDLEAQPGRFVSRLHHKQNRTAGQPEWVPRPWTDAWRRAALAVAVGRHRPDVVLQINELAVLTVPYWVYRDMTWAQVEAYGGDSATGVIAPSIVQARRRHEDHVHGQAEGVFTFSDWAASSVRQTSGARCVVVNPGSTAQTRPRMSGSNGRELLFVGRAFERKGGRELLAAFARLSARRPDVLLHVVGPDRLPADVPRPEGLVFHGPLGRGAVQDLLERADAFVLPSRFEAYGIALVEALCAGLPCVARDICAMPEILDDGRYGVLVGSEDPEDLAEALEQVLMDPAPRAALTADLDMLRSHYTWDRAARQMLQHMLAG